MKDISAFQVIGPNMIGPSSSHTAGALRITQLAGNMIKGKITRAVFLLYGSFAQTYKGHGTDRALAAGILGFGPEDYRIKDSLYYAEEAGVELEFKVDYDRKDVHPNTVTMFLTNHMGEQITVTGVSTGGGAAKIVEINGVTINLSGEYTAVLIQHQDTPGVAAHITKCLSDSGINIAYMKLYREKKGHTAYTIVEADESIPPEVVERMEGHSAVQSALLIE